MEYNLIIPNPLYEISSSLDIRRTDGNDLDLVIEKEWVTVDLYGTTRRVKLRWLWAIAHFNVDLPEHVRDRLIDIDFVRIQHLPTFSKTRLTMIFKEPIEYNAGYRIVPNFTQLAVNIYGSVLDITKNELLKSSINSKGYATISTYNNDNHVKTATGVHRLVALAWVNNHDYFNRFTVNHIDGKKTNNYYRNLEWTSSKENVNHAKMYDLRTDHIPCKVRDIKTGKVTEHKSTADACSYMGLTGKRSIDLLTRPIGHLINGRYEYKLLEDDTPWYYTDTHEAPKYLGRQLFKVIYQNGDVTEHHGKIRLARDLGLTHSESYLQISAFSKVMDLVKSHRSDIKDIEVIEKFDTGGVELKNIRSDKVTKFKSIREASRFLNLSTDVVRNRLKDENRNKSIDGKWLVKLINDTREWPTDIVHENKSIKVKIKNAVEEKVFNSMSSAASYLGVNLSVIQLRLKGNKELVNGYTVRAA